MKRVIATPTGAELELIRTMLQQAGVPCVIRNEQLSELLGTTPFNAELWVECDEDLPKARELYAAWCASASETMATWTCPACGQLLALQFDSCWQCGTYRNRSESTLPGSWDEASQRAEKMSSLLQDILHQSD